MCNAIVLSHEELAGGSWQPGSRELSDLMRLADPASLISRSALIDLSLIWAANFESERRAASESLHRLHFGRACSPCLGLMLQVNFPSRPGC
jgi:hypothetical protein